jgi:diguanylate cyclase (GGDEF)-like protein
MAFPRELEPEYVEQVYAWQRPRLRRLVLLAPLLLLMYVGLQGLLIPGSLTTLTAQPRLYVLFAILLLVALWMRPLARAMPFAWAGVALQALFCLSCALLTWPADGAVALVLPVFVATPLVTAPFWGRTKTVIAAIALGYLAGFVALWVTRAGSTLWLAYGLQAASGALIALAMHSIVDHARRGRFLAEIELAQRARLDSLTSLLNRRHFIEAGEALVAGMHAGRRLCACFIDLDHFKRVNDQGGHRIGDQLLVGVAAQLLGVSGGKRVVGRLGGEEFALLLPGMPPGDVHALAEDLRMQIAGIEVEGYRVNASVGIACWETGESLSDLLHRADLALLEAKRSGRNRIVHWSPALDALPV